MSAALAADVQRFRFPLNLREPASTPAAREETPR
jgi:hypothetical protein